MFKIINIFLLLSMCNLFNSHRMNKTSFNARMKLRVANLKEKFFAMNDIKRFQQDPLMNTVFLNNRLLYNIIVKSGLESMIMLGFYFYEFNVILQILDHVSSSFLLSLLFEKISKVLLIIILMRKISKLPNIINTTDNFLTNRSLSVKFIIKPCLMMLSLWLPKLLHKYVFQGLHQKNLSDASCVINKFYFQYIKTPLTDYSNKLDLCNKYCPEVFKDDGKQLLYLLGLKEINDFILQQRASLNFFNINCVFIIIYFLINCYVYFSFKGLNIGLNLNLQELELPNN